MIEDHVEFIAKPGVTVYTGTGAVGVPPGEIARMPQSHADALEDLRHVPEVIVQEPPAMASGAPQEQPARTKGQEVNALQDGAPAFVPDGKKPPV